MQGFRKMWIFSIGIFVGFGIIVTSLGILRERYNAMRASVLTEEEMKYISGGIFGWSCGFTANCSLQLSADCVPVEDPEAPYGWRCEGYCYSCQQGAILLCESTIIDRGCLNSTGPMVNCGKATRGECYYNYGHPLPIVTCACWGDMLPLPIDCQMQDCANGGC
jgi:hypothetical protein